jgi:hypothetical protein
MKKIMSIMLGLSLVIGAASIAFSQDAPKEEKKKKGKKKTGDRTVQTPTTVR